MFAATLKRAEGLYLLASRHCAGRPAPAVPDGPEATDHPDTAGHIEIALSEMHPGEQGHVLALRGEPDARQHLLEMGFTSGTPVEFIRVAPMGDPLTVRIRGYQLSLRRREAQTVWVRRCPPEPSSPQPETPHRGG